MRLPWLIDVQGRFYTLTLFTAQPDLWRFDPASNSWGKLTTAPSEGSFMLVTPMGTHGDVALWFLGTRQGQVVLYRYEV